MSDEEYDVDEMVKILKESDEIVNKFNEEKSNQHASSSGNTPMVITQTIDKLEDENVVRTFYCTNKLHYCKFKCNSSLFLQKLEQDLLKYERTHLTPVKNELQGIITRYKATVEKYRARISNYDSVSTTVKKNNASISVLKRLRDER